VLEERIADPSHGRGAATLVNRTVLVPRN